MNNPNDTCKVHLVEPEFGSPYWRKFIFCSDDGALNEYCKQVLMENPKSIVDYKKGKLNALNHLKGQVMKLTKGKADITKVETILKSKMI